MNYKPFNLEQAKAQNGEGLITRDGRPARIVCWDFKEDCYPLLVAVTEKYDGGREQEFVISVTSDGKEFMTGDSDGDLFMAPTKHEGWVNVYDMSYDKRGVAKTIFDSEEEAKKMGEDGGYEVGGYYIATIHIEWED